MNFNFKKNILKFFLLICIFFAQSAFALKLPNKIDKAIDESNFELKSIVSIYAENSKNNKILYKKNEQKLLNPASSLKALTFAASYLTLGCDYNFETALYKDKDGNLYIKLAADPDLTSNDLNNLFKSYKGNINTIYIDDSIIDKVEYPNGWMVEDVWPNSAKLSPYIINDNKVKISINRSSLATKIDIIQNDEYKFAVINELKPGKKQEYEIQRNYGENSPIITFSGTINKDETITLPVVDSKINFEVKLKKALEKNNIVYLKKFCVKKTPLKVTKVASISRSIDEVSRKILLNSNNYSSEIVFKVAGGKFKNKDYGSTADGLEMFNCIFKNIRGIDEIKITDASGVSRSNLVSTKFIVKTLKEIFKNEQLKNLYATANTGTLKDRLPFLENNLRAKTGTLMGLSTISGTLNSNSNEDIVFSIIIQNSLKRKALLKNFENKIIGILYRYY